MDPDRDDAARLRRGDTAGLAGLLSRHQDRLFRYLLRLVGDEAVAEDAFQQTWLKVAERIGAYDRSRPFAPWLFAVARNLALDHLRRRQPESLEDVAEPIAPGGPDADPLAHAAARQRGTRLADAVAGDGSARPRGAVPPLRGGPGPAGARRDPGRAGADREGAALPGARPPARPAPGPGAGRGLAMSDHVTDRLALAAAGALDPAEQARVEAHLGECATCASGGGGVARPRRGARHAARAAAVPRPRVRTVAGVERLLAERSERAWNRAALGFLVGFAWTLTVVSWLFLDLVTGDLALRLGRSLALDHRVVRDLCGGGMVDGGCGRGAARPERAGRREDGMSRFDREWALVPTGARWTAVLVALAVATLMADVLPRARGSRTSTGPRVRHAAGLPAPP